MKPRILFVDDDDDMLMLLQRVAQRAELFSTVMTATGAREAFGLLEPLPESARPHLILTDLKMPGIRGDEFIRQLKRNPDTRHLPVAVLTSSDLPEEQSACVSAGACGYYIKTGNLAELEQVFRSALVASELAPPAIPPELGAQ